MTVKIEMDMPKNCSECVFCDYVKEKSNFLCFATEKRDCITIAQFLNDKRISKCPLREVKE